MKGNVIEKNLTFGLILHGETLVGRPFNWGIAVFAPQALVLPNHGAL